MTLSIIELIISCMVIFIGTEVLVNSSVALSNKLRIPRVVVGTLIVSLATSLPELFVSLKSVSLGLDEFALGNIIGSNIFNVAFVMGSIGIYEVPIRQSYNIELGALAFASLFLVMLVMVKRNFHRFAGVVFLATYGAIIYHWIR